MFQVINALIFYMTTQRERERERYKTQKRESICTSRDSNALRERSKCLR